MSADDITVVIPTYLRADSLLSALQSLQAQTLTEFEILVVDNAAEQVLAEQVTEFNRTARVPARYVPEPELGLHNARHRGVREAKHGLLVFTDDDATFAPSWLASYSRAFDEHGQMAAAGGPVRPAWQVPPPDWLLDFMGDAKSFGHLSLMEPYQEFRLDPKGYFWGVNMAIRRELLFEVGGFNPEAFGDTWLGDGESGLNHKLWDRGMLIGYVPGAVVYHQIPPQRMTLSYLRQRTANQGACDLYTYFHRREVNWPRLVRYMGAVGKKNIIYIIAALLVRGRTDIRSLRLQLLAEAALSQLKYAARLILDRKLRKLVAQDRWIDE